MELLMRWTAASRTSGLPRHVVEAGKYIAGAVADERLGVVARTHVKRHWCGELFRIGPRQTGEQPLT
jgi:hypothetical protein